MMPKPQKIYNEQPHLNHTSSTASPYLLYLNSLATSGRNPMTALLNHCALLLGHKGKPSSFDWNQLTFEKVHILRATLIDMGYSVNTVNMTIAGLRGVTKAAFNLGQMSADNMLRISAIKSVKGRTSSRKGRSLNREEIQQLLTACTQLPTRLKQARDKALLLVGAGAGLRCAEICALNLADINFTAGSLIVEEGKGRKQRRIYLSQDVLSPLQDWASVRGNEEGALFTRVLKNGSTSERLTPSGLTYALKSIQTLSGTPRFSPHDLRRTFITHLLEQGIDLNTVRQLAGHSDLSTTVRYDKRDEAWQRQASQNIRL